MLNVEHYLGSTSSSILYILERRQIIFFTFTVQSSRLSSCIGLHYLRDSARRLVSSCFALELTTQACPRPGHIQTCSGVLRITSLVFILCHTHSPLAAETTTWIRTVELPFENDLHSSGPYECQVIVSLSAIDFRDIWHQAVAEKTKQKQSTRLQCETAAKLARIMP